MGTEEDNEEEEDDDEEEEPEDDADEYAEDEEEEEEEEEECGPPVRPRRSCSAALETLPRRTVEEAAERGLMSPWRKPAAAPRGRRATGRGEARAPGPALEEVPRLLLQAALLRLPPLLLLLLLLLLSGASGDGAQGGDGVGTFFLHGRQLREVAGENELNSAEGHAGFSRRRRPMASSFSKRSGWSMEHSSMTSTSVLRQLPRFSGHVFSFPTYSPTDSSPRPMPAQECSVLPLTSTAAGPVVAVTATVRPLRRRR